MTKITTYPSCIACSRQNAVVYVGECKYRCRFCKTYFTEGQMARRQRSAYDHWLASPPEQRL